MAEKFWMIKGSAGAPVVAYHDKDSALNRAIEVARESGQPAYLLEVVAVATPAPVTHRHVIVEHV